MNKLINEYHQIQRYLKLLIAHEKEKTLNKYLEILIPVYE